jgi:pyruvate/2-oxoglutarate dehydrogenase complex dihydrolipoamide acyltransferase (E2) component
LLLPAFVRDIGYWVFSRSPHVIKKNIGTVQLTAVGMFGEGGGWGVTPSLYTLGVLVGGIACKPGVVDGRIEIRDYLSLTLSFDHDVVDGAPAARFAQHFKELLESGYGLGE